VPGRQFVRGDRAGRRRTIPARPFEKLVGDDGLDGGLCVTLPQTGAGVRGRGGKARPASEPRWRRRELGRSNKAE